VIVLLALAVVADPAVVLMHTSTAAIEQRVFEEIALELESIEVRRRPAPRGLADLPAASQVDVLRPVFQESAVLACGWLDRSAGALRLNLVFAREGRTDVRSIDEPNRPGAPAAIALAAREVIAGVALARRLRAEREMIETSTAAAAHEDPVRWSVGVAGTVDHGIASRAGPDPRFGAAVAVSVGFAGSFTAGLGVLFRAGRDAEGADTNAVGGSLRVSWRPSWGALSLGPTVGAEVVSLELDVEDETLAEAQLRLRAGLIAGVELVDAVALSFGADLVVVPRPIEVRDRLDDATVFDTGTLGFAARLGLEFFL